MSEFRKLIAEKGRVVQWITVGGAVVACICGGFGGFLDGQQIKDILIYSMMAAFGLEATIRNHEG